jgi:quinol monooxygenase YgiN
MSEAEEYTQNAHIGAASAEPTESERDQTIWFRMSETWRDLATMYIQNAQNCAACAENTKSENDRTIWLRMSEAWRDLATIAEQRASTIHQSEAAAA